MRNQTLRSGLECFVSALPVWSSTGTEKTGSVSHFYRKYSTFAVAVFRTEASMLRVLMLYLITVVICGLSACSSDDQAGSSLTNISASEGRLIPAFSPDINVYKLQVPFWIDSVQVTVTSSNPSALIFVNGAPVASGRQSTQILLGSSITMISVTEQVSGLSDRIYSIAATRTPQTYMKASDTGIDDQFGSKISISGDTIVVGAPNENCSSTGINGEQVNNNAQDSGAVYVFVRTGTVWAQQAYIKASNTNASDRFGTSVSIHGDTLAVGASGESSDARGINGDQTNNNATNSGAVYIFIRSGTTWTQQAYIKASNADANDSFGAYVSLSGDTLAVGAPGEASSAILINGNQMDNSAPFSGAVYIFVRTGITWAQQAYVKSHNTEFQDFFCRVSLSGDILAVGASLEDSDSTGINGNQTSNAARNSGAVYVYTRKGVTWTHDAYIKASNAGKTNLDEQFGFSLSLSGSTLAVGSFGESSRGLQSGAVYVFVRTGTTWTEQAYLKASNAENNDGFGSSVALSGDTLVVGAPAEDGNAQGINGDQLSNSALNSGAVYVYRRTGTLWTQKAYLKASNTESDDQFGSAVALSADTLAVGAPLEDSKATGINGIQGDNSIRESGAVYVF